VELVYGSNSVLLRFVNFVPPAPPPVVPITDFASFALTPDQKAAANLLGAVQLDPRTANLISFLDKEPFANLPRDFDKISPFHDQEWNMFRRFFPGEEMNSAREFRRC
jgi:hypothetical protein